MKTQCYHNTFLSILVIKVTGSEDNSEDQLSNESCSSSGT